MEHVSEGERLPASVYGVDACGECWHAYTPRHREENLADFRAMVRRYFAPGTVIECDSCGHRWQLAEEQGPRGVKARR